jgi:hypothetical protein
MELRSSLDCCSKEEIKENIRLGRRCPICNDIGYLIPNSVLKEGGLNGIRKKLF